MSELKQKAMRGVRWTTLAAGVTAMGGLVQLFVLPRLLDAHDFALMGVANVALGLALQLVDMGFSNAILRDSTTGKAQLHSFYWTNIGLGLLLALGMWAAAAPIAAFFPKLDGEKLAYIVQLISPAFLLSALGMQHQTLLQKALRFKELALIEIVSFTMGFALTLGLAWAGYGAQALAWGVLGKITVQTLCLLALGLPNHRPALHFAWADLQAVWRFGALQSLEKIVAYTAINADTILVARIFPPALSGAYEVAKRLLVQPWYVLNPIVTKVMYPVMAQVNRDTPRLRNIALRAIHLVTFLNTPIYIGCALGADLIVPVLFGAKWTAAILPFRWLAVAYLIRSILNPFGSVILAKGRGSLALGMQLGTFWALILSIVAGAYYGLEGMLWAMCAFNLILVAICQYFIGKPLLESTWADLLNQIKLEIPIAVLAFSLGVLCAQNLALGFVSLGLYLAIGAGIYLYAVLRLRPVLLKDVQQMLFKKGNAHA
jgi:lipopolysaccharide exporter